MDDQERWEGHRRLHSLGIPVHPEVAQRQKDAELSRVALENCQNTLQTALGYLKAVVSGTVEERIKAGQEAKRWLEKIGA